jgi:hypothetical protein
MIHPTGEFENTFYVEHILYEPTMNMIHPIGDFETT